MPYLQDPVEITMSSSPPSSFVSIGIIYYQNYNNPNYLTTYRMS